MIHEIKRCKMDTGICELITQTFKDSNGINNPLSEVSQYQLDLLLKSVYPHIWIDHTDMSYEDAKKFDHMVFIPEQAELIFIKYYSLYKPKEFDFQRLKPFLEIKDDDVYVIGYVINDIEFPLDYVRDARLLEFWNSEILNIISVTGIDYDIDKLFNTISDSKSYVRYKKMV